MEARHDRHAVADRLLRHAVQQYAGRGQRRAQERHLDHLAAPALGARVQGERDRQRTVNGAVGGGQRDRSIDRRALRPCGSTESRSVNRPQAAFSTPSNARMFAFPWSVDANPGQRQVNQARMPLGDHVRAEPEPVPSPPDGSSRSPRRRRGDQAPGGGEPGLALEGPTPAASCRGCTSHPRDRALRAPGRSILITCAPWSASNMPASGPRDVVAEIDHPHPGQGRCAIGRHAPPSLGQRGRARLLRRRRPWGRLYPTIISPPIRFRRCRVERAEYKWHDRGGRLEGAAP